MYQIIGADGKQYGPVSLEQVRKWVAEGRVNAQTKIREASATEWQSASEVPEVNALLVAHRAALPPLEPARGAPGNQKRSGLAITSFVFGILSMLCLGLFTGLPAIICGHVAHRRSRRSPDQYGGRGLAIAGFVMGYIGFLGALFLAGKIFMAVHEQAAQMNFGRQAGFGNQAFPNPPMPNPPFANRNNIHVRSVGSPGNCAGNLREIALAFRAWALDHDDRYPFNLSTNGGGTLELCAPDANGYDRNALHNFIMISNELANAAYLVCPGDSSKIKAPNFQGLAAGNVTYWLRVGPDVNTTNDDAVLAICPVHGTEVLTDGRIRQGAPPKR